MGRLLSCCFVVALVAVGLTGCGEDELGYEIWLQPQDSTLPADGTASTQLLISVLRDDLTPVPVGSRVAIVCVDSSSQPAGLFQGGDEGQTALYLDEVGSGAVRVFCNGEPDEEDFLLCVARFESEQTRANAPITCIPSSTEDGGS